MPKKWFQHKEVMAGTKRLIISYYLYKFLGEFPLRIIAFFIVLGAFFTSKEKRDYSAQFFKLLENFTGKKYPLLSSSFKQFLNYGNSLVDKIISFIGDFSVENFEFMENSYETVYKYINSDKGVFLLTTHVGNAEILRSLLFSDKYKRPAKVNIFLEQRSCEIFNGFLNKVKKEINATTYPVEEISVNTAIELSEKLQNGELIFMAGDRVSMSNSDKTYCANLLNKRVNLPIGALKFAQILNFPIIFIVCVKENNKYSIYAEEFTPNTTSKKETLEQLKQNYSEFLQKYTLKFPHQFYHFYKFFEDNQ